MADYGLRYLGPESIAAVMGNRTLVSPALAAGTNAGTIKTTVTMPFLNNGEFFSKAITDNIALTALGVQADNTTYFYTLCISSAGTVTVTRGTTIQPPTAGSTVFGLMKVVTAGGTFTPGTTALDATGVTTTFRNLSMLPAEATY